MPEMPGYRIEVCVVSCEQAMVAYHDGAARLELCSRLETEGMTPDVALLSNILDEVNIPVRVMIRETEVGFESDAAVIEKMKSSISSFKSLSIDGFVIGLLKDNRLDHEAMKELIACCSPFPVTVHKAIDHSQDVQEDLLWLNQFEQVDTILTSGGQRTALEGIDQILKMKSVFERDIMAAGKITHDQLPVLHKSLGLTWYHGRRIILEHVH